MRFIVDNCQGMNVLDTMVRCASDDLDAPQWGPTPEQCSSNPKDKLDDCKKEMLRDWNHLGQYNNNQETFPTEWKCSDNWAKTNCLKTCCDFKAELKSPSECEGAEDTWNSESWITNSADACKQWSQNNDWGAWTEWKTLSQACDSDHGGWGMKHCKKTCCEHKKNLDLLHESKLACPTRNPGWLSLPLRNTSFSATKDCYEGLVDESSLNAALVALQSHGSFCNAITLSRNRYHGRVVDERCKFCVGCCANTTTIGDTSWVLISTVSLPPPPAPPAPPHPPFPPIKFTARQASFAQFMSTDHVEVSFKKTLKICATQFKIALSANLGMIAADEVFQKAHNLLRSTEFTRNACEEEKCPKSLSDMGKETLTKGIMACALSGVMAQEQSPELNEMVKNFPELKELKENIGALAGCFSGTSTGDCKMMIATTPINKLVGSKIEAMCEKFSDKIAEKMMPEKGGNKTSKDIKQAELKFCKYFLMDIYDHWSGRDEITCERIVKKCSKKKCNPEEDPDCNDDDDNEEEDSDDDDDDADDTGDDPTESDPGADPDPGPDISDGFDDVIDDEIAEVLEEEVAETVDEVIETAVDVTITESTSAAMSAAVDAAEIEAASSEAAESAMEAAVMGAAEGAEGAELVMDIVLGLTAL